MITLLTGENSYEIGQALKHVAADFDGEAERYDGAEIESRQLPDLLMGVSLFAEKRLIIVRGLSASKAAWELLPELTERMSDDIHLVLVEPTVDKRTKTYKALQKIADVQMFAPLTERDSQKAEQWLMNEAKRRGVKLDTASARVIVRRSLAPTERGQPVIDQWQAIHSLEKLSVLGDITPEIIEAYIEAQPIESVFGLFETALKGDAEKVHQLLNDLEPREDPFRVFGLLSGQVFQLAALFFSSEAPADTAKAIGAHPFAMNKLVPLIKKLHASDMKQIVAALAEADEAMKTSKGTPWLLIEQALMKIALVAKAK